MEAQAVGEIHSLAVPVVPERGPDHLLYYLCLRPREWPAYLESCSMGLEEKGRNRVSLSGGHGGGWLWEERKEERQAGRDQCPLQKIAVIGLRTGMGQHIGCRAERNKALGTVSNDNRVFSEAPADFRV